MQPREALDRLVLMLREREVTIVSDDDDFRGTGIDARSAWEAFCDLAREPALEPFDDYGEQVAVADDADCDLLVADIVSRQSGRCILECGRYFSYYLGDDDYAGTTALRLEIEFASDVGDAPSLRGYGGRRHDDVDDSTHPEFASWAGWAPSWKAAVETTEPYRLALQAPVAFRLSQSNI